MEKNRATFFHPRKGVLQQQHQQQQQQQQNLGVCFAIHPVYPLKSTCQIVPFCQCPKLHNDTEAKKKQNSQPSCTTTETHTLPSLTHCKMAFLHFISRSENSRQTNCKQHGLLVRKNHDKRQIIAQKSRAL